MEKIIPAVPMASNETSAAVPPLRTSPLDQPDHALGVQQPVSAAPPSGSAPDLPGQASGSKLAALPPRSRSSAIRASTDGDSHTADLRTDGLSMRYPNGHMALDAVSVELRAGAFIAVIGLSGAGKSTFLRCLNRLAEPTGGRAYIGTTEITGLSGSNLRLLRRRIGFVFQQFHLVRTFTALDNVMAGRIAHHAVWRNLLGMYPPAEREFALEWLQTVGLGAFAGRRADTLSGGQQQRVAIARACAQEPDWIFADEPTASLDPLSARDVLELLRTLHRERHLGVLVNLHHVGHAKTYADRILGFREGRIVFDGPPATLDTAALIRIYGERAAEIVGEDGGGLNDLSMSLPPRPPPAPPSPDHLEAATP